MNSQKTLQLITHKSGHKPTTPQTTPTQQPNQHQTQPKPQQRTTQNTTPTIAQSEDQSTNEKQQKQSNNTNLTLNPTTTGTQPGHCRPLSKIIQPQITILPVILFEVCAGIGTSRIALQIAAELMLEVRNVQLVVIQTLV